MCFLSPRPRQDIVPIVWTTLYLYILYMLTFQINFKSIQFDLKKNQYLRIVRSYAKQ